MVVAHKILETAQSLNFSLAQSLGLGLGLGLISKIMLPVKSPCPVIRRGNIRNMYYSILNF